MRIIGIIVVLWLVIGGVAAFQRGYFDKNESTTCANAGTIALTALAGPLNYVGLNPKVGECRLPEPSK